jgi:hypothetical protein
MSENDNRNGQMLTTKPMVCPSVKQVTKGLGSSKVDRDCSYCWASQAVPLMPSPTVILVVERELEKIGGCLHSFLNQRMKE